MNAEIGEVSSVQVISKLNGNKQVAAEVVRGLKGQNKVWLMFVQGKSKQKNLRQKKTIKNIEQVITDLI